MNFDLDNIKKEIEERRNQSIIKEETLGTGGGIRKTDSKRFIVELLNSVNSGVPTPAVQAIRAVSESTEANHGVPVAVAKSHYTPPTPAVRQQVNEFTQPVQNTQMYDRRDAFFEEQMAKAKDLVTRKQTTPNQNTGLSQQLAEYATSQYVGAGATQQPLHEVQQYGAINPSLLNEQIRKTMIDVLGGNTFDKLVEETFRNVITEMYTREKIENVINEFIESGKFKKVVVETILDIQKRKQTLK